MPDLIADALGFAVVRERPVEEEDVGRHLLELAVLGVERALRRAGEQPEHQRSHGRDQAHPHLHDVLRLRAEMMLGQDGTQGYAEERSAEDARESDPGDLERRHRSLPFLPSRRAALSGRPASRPFRSPTASSTIGCDRSGRASFRAAPRCITWATPTLLYYERFSGATLSRRAAPRGRP